MNRDEQCIADRIESVIAPARVSVRQGPEAGEYAIVTRAIIPDQLAERICLATGAAVALLQRDYDAHATAIGLLGVRP
jgi:hypothetical protein